MPSQELNQTKDADSLLGEVVDEFFDQLSRGDVPDIDDFVQRYPEIAESIRHGFPALQLVGQPTINGAEHTADWLKSKQLGDFRIVRQIGRGGMGIVFEAKQVSMGRRVAIKVLPFASMIDLKPLERFRNEVRAVGTLDHPNIVSVYSVGEERGVHFYAMQLIRGQSLAAVIKQLQNLRDSDSALSGSSIGKIVAVSDTDSDNVSRKERSMTNDVHCESDAAQTYKQETRAFGGSATSKSGTDRGYYSNVAQLGIQVAKALSHAHEHGIIHRDIKPGNLMLDAQGQLFVTDFGLARIEAAGVTMTGDWMGTPRYMSPEQALGKKIVIDHRIDIYSLGVTLYEMLTLRPAFDAKDRQALLWQIGNDEPTRPRAIDSRIPRELETIVLNAISKNRDERYDTASDFAIDLQCFLEDKPIKAKSPTMVQRAARWSRQHKSLVASVAVLMVLLTIGLAISTLLVDGERRRANAATASERAQKAIAVQERKQTERERQVAIEQRNVARQNQYYAEMVAGQSQVDEGNPGGLFADLIKYLPQPGEEDLRGWEWYYLMSKCRPEERTINYPGSTPFAAWSPDGKYIGISGGIWEAETGKCIRRFSTSNYSIRYRVAWNPDGNKFAWGMSGDESVFYIWDRFSDQVSRFAGHDSSVWCLAWSPDGSQIASGSNDKTIKVWDVSSQLVLWELSDFPNGVMNIGWSPDNKMLAVGIHGEGIQIWEIASHAKVYERMDKSPYSYFHMVAWHPDSNSLAVCEDDKWFILKRDDWTIQYEQNITRGHAIAWSPDGSLIAVGHAETVDVWDSERETLVAQLNGHRNPVYSISWHPGGRRLVSGDRSQEIKLWDLDQLEMPAFDTKTGVKSVAWKDNGTRIAVENQDGSSTWWDPRDGALKQHETTAVKSPVARCNYRNLAAVYNEDRHTISILDASTGANRSIIKVDPDRRLIAATFSNDGSTIAVQSELEASLFLEVWNVDREQHVWTWESKHAKSDLGWLHLVRWNADGSLFAAVGVGDLGGNGDFWSDHVHVFDAAQGTRKHLFLPQNHKEEIQAVAWNEDGRLLAIGTEDGRVEALDAETGRRVFAQKIHGEGITALAWHPDGSRLAVGSRNGKVKLVSCREGKVLLNFAAFKTKVSSLAWSNDGQQLAAATSEGEIQTWNTSRASQITTGDARRGELAWAYYDRSLQATNEAHTDSLKEFVHIAPDELGYWKYRGDAYAELGQFGRAIEEFSKAVGPELRYSFTFDYCRVWALLGDNRLDEYQRASQKLVEVFQESPVPSIQVYVAWLALLSSNSIVDSDSLVKMAGNHQGNNFWRLVQGTALYRNGQFAQANQLLTELADDMGSTRTYWISDHDMACTKYVLSMSRFSLGQEFQARRLLDEANERAESFFNRAPGSRWTWRVAIKTLRKEATTKIAD